MSTKRDYYEVLGVERSASEADIKAAFRKAALKFHPDRNPNDQDAAAKFREVNEAYEVLSTPEKRQMYDRFGHQGMGEGGFGDMGDMWSGVSSIFEEFFGFQGPQGQGRSRGRPGRDLQIRAQLTFEEAFHGVKKTFSFTRTQLCAVCKGTRAENDGVKTCTKCRGTGAMRVNQGIFAIQTTCNACEGTGSMITKPCKSCKGQGLEKVPVNLDLDIPAGADSGKRIRVTGQGEGGSGGAPSGDLYIELFVQPSKDFTRKEAHLFSVHAIGMAQAALGCQATVKTPTGEKTIEIPPGTQPGTQFTLQGEGMPYWNSPGRGDLVVEVEIGIPKKLSKEQKELLEKFAALAGEETQQHKSMFSKIFGD